MKRILTILLAGLTLSSFAQTATPTAKPSYPVKGSINIRYATRAQASGGKLKEGVSDTYAINVNVANSVLFKGQITHLPYIINTVTDQPGKVSYEIDLDVMNPANPAQTKNVGKLFGTAPIDKMNVYRFSDGGVKVAVLPIGQARGFESRFNGLALAKPPATKSLMSSIKQEAVRLTSAKGGSITLTKYDKMEFQNHVLPAGPVQIYPETTVNGTLFYDYGRSAWHFNNVTFVYGLDGKRLNDTLTGSIRWIEEPNRKATGEGRYEFDIRVNEPPPSESAVFSTSVNDEASFFAVDTEVPAFTGTLKYKDTIQGGTVIASDVQIDLKSNNLTKAQVMYLCKLLFLSSVVPLNAE